MNAVELPELEVWSDLEVAGLIDALMSEVGRGEINHVLNLPAGHPHYEPPTQEQREARRSRTLARRMAAEAKRAIRLRQKQEEETRRALEWSEERRRVLDRARVYEQLERWGPSAAPKIAERMGFTAEYVQSLLDDLHGNLKVRPV